MTTKDHYLNKIIFTLTMLNVITLAKLCSMDDMRQRAHEACGNLARNARSTDLDPSLYDYKVINETERTRFRRSLRHHKTKMYTRDDFPDGYLMISNIKTSSRQHHNLDHLKVRAIETNAIDNDFDFQPLEMQDSKPIGKYSKEHRAHNRHHRHHPHHHQNHPHRQHHLDRNEIDSAENHRYRQSNDLYSKHNLALSDSDADNSNELRIKRGDVHPVVYYCCEHPEADSCDLHLC